mmetsp:Transcript_23049/g.57725  ORF Transcript_23049/g.57725 Transcript_23049/m.57725 type:complete len:210 (-) Transcript_23049:598-1227(-)
MWGSHKDSLGGDAVHVESGTGLEVEQMHIAELGDHVEHTVLLAYLHGNRKVSIGVCRIVDVHHALCEGGTSIGLAHLADEQLGAGGTTSGERHQRTRLGSTRYCEIRKCSRMTFNHLILLFVHTIQLHRASDTTITLGDTDEQKPTLCAIGTIVDNLGRAKSGVTGKDASRRSSTFDTPVVDGRGGHNGQGAGADPLPKVHRFADRELL